jgi:hypothetical protein
VFRRQAYLDIPQGSRFVGRISLGLEPMVQGTQSFRQVWAARCVIPYIL